KGGVALEADRMAGGGAGFRQQFGVGADDGGAGELAHKRAEPVGEILHHQVEDEAAGSAAARHMALDERRIEEARCGHGGLAVPGAVGTISQIWRRKPALSKARPGPRASRRG